MPAIPLEPRLIGQSIDDRDVVSFVSQYLEQPHTSYGSWIRYLGSGFSLEIDDNRIVESISVMGVEFCNRQNLELPDRLNTLRTLELRAKARSGSSLRRIEKDIVHARESAKHYGPYTGILVNNVSFMDKLSAVADKMGPASKSFDRPYALAGEFQELCDESKRRGVDVKDLMRVQHHLQYRLPNSLVEFVFSADQSLYMASYHSIKR